MKIAVIITPAFNNLAELEFNFQKMKKILITIYGDTTKPKKLPSFNPRMPIIDGLISEYNFMTTNLIKI